MIERFKLHFKGYRTVIIGAMIGLPLALLQILEALQMVDMNTILPPPWGQRIALGTSVLMVLLRLVTNTPVGVETPPTGTQELK